MTPYEEITAKLREFLIDLVEPEIIRQVESSVCLALDDYDLTKKERSLVVYERTDIEIVNRFFLAKAVQGCTPRTLELYKRNLSLGIQTMNKHIKDIEADDVRLYLARKKMQKVSSSYLANIHRTFSSFFTWATAEGWVEAEQKQREVDLGDEIEKRVMKLRTVPTYDELVGFARHFYELGQKGRGQQVRRIEYNRQRATGVISFEYRIIGRNTIENLDMNELEKAGIGWGDEVIVQIMKKEESK